MLGRHTKGVIPLCLLMAALALSCGPNNEKAMPAAGGPSSGTPLAVEVARAVAEKLSTSVRLPGELQPYEIVAVYPKVTGFVKWITVDRGSRVKSGQLIAQLEAPELAAQRAEAQSKLASAESHLAAARAKLAASESTYQRLKAAAATPGVVAGNDLVVAGKAADADRATVAALQNTAQAARDALSSISQVEDYLRITAPFDGVVTERNVHPGALVGPAGGPGAMVPMLRIETLRRLRLVVPVPETYVAGVPEGTSVDFRVPAFPGRTFQSPIARISHAVDVKTRTMPVELDVRNPSGLLTPGSFCEVQWPVRRPNPTLFVPASAVATNLERTFVIRIRDGKAEWVDVKTGVTMGNRVEVFGDLHEGDMVAVRGTDELRSGTAVTPREASGT